MTLVSDIIQQAYRESNLVMAGASVSSTQETEALKRLNVLVLPVLGQEAGVKFTDLPVGEGNVSDTGFYAVPWTETYPLPANVRLVANLEGATELLLCPEPEDGARLALIDASGNLATHNLTLTGNGRLIEAATTLVLSTDSLSAQWFYRADLGDWRRVTDFVAADEFPFPPEFDDFFVVMLAMRLNPRHGRALAEESGAAFAKSRTAFRNRYRQTITRKADAALMLTGGRRCYGGDIIHGW
jgi:hypothetical protein